MGILSRFTDIISANINALLDKAENPEKMIDEYLRRAMEDLAEVKQETAAVMAEENRCQRLWEENRKDAEKYTDLAKKALLAGNEGDARVFLQKKQELEQAGVSLEKTYQAARQNAEKMRQMHDKLTEDINTLKARRQNVKATMAVARTQEKVNRAQEAFDGAGGAIQGFARMEEKAQAMLDQANAMAELNQRPAAPAVHLETGFPAALPGRLRAVGAPLIGVVGARAVLHPVPGLLPAAAAVCGVHSCCPSCWCWCFSSFSPVWGMCFTAVPSSLQEAGTSPAPPSSGSRWTRPM